MYRGSEKTGKVGATLLSYLDARLTESSFPGFAALGRLEFSNLIPLRTTSCRV